jgi:hypothetical protein
MGMPTRSSERTLGPRLELTCELSFERKCGLESGFGGETCPA